ncbi:hypothetical protein [Streptomyces avicenniae]|uniref:hypothetical protein n=1 Tax=Streptomyces avicenniae TaxID=500153 RepID=UPI00069BDDB0|nr:hypothetical protein [Streptomyces avicenniae]
MDEIQVELTGGPFAGLPAVLRSHVGDRVQVEVTVFGRRTSAEVRADQVRVAGAPLPETGLTADPATRTHAALRDRITTEHERLAGIEAFTFVLDRLDTPETDPAADWDAYVAHRDAAQAGARARGRAALDRFDRELAPLPVTEAQRAIDAEAAFWHPGSAAGREQQERFPGLHEPNPEERLLAAIFGEQRDEPTVTPHERARLRLERARLAAEERDHERWRAALSPEERDAHPTKGNPARYAYARAPRQEVSLPPERSVEWAVRSATGVGHGPVPQDALDAVDGLDLTLHRPSDLTPLGRLPNLRRLSVRSRVQIDLVALAAALCQARGLEELSIEAPVRDLAPLARLGQLRSLELDHTRVTDLAPLAGLTRLSDLSVLDGPLSDLTPLAGLRLGRLFVHRTRVGDLSPLAGMPTLGVLGLVGCPVLDLSVVTTLPALRFVNLRGTRVTDLGDLPERAPGVTFEGVGEDTAQATGTEDAVADAPGAPVTDAVAAALRTAFRAADDDPARLTRVERAMLAGRRLDLVQELVVGRWGSRRSTVEGLFLRGGAGDVPFPDNPWGIPSGAGLTRALTQVWAPVAGLAPGFVTAVHERTLGLALLRDEQGAPALGYLVWRRDGDRSEPLADTPDSLDRFADPERDLRLSVVVGSAPHAADPAAVVPLLAGPVPRPVRDLWAVHHGLDNGWERVGGGLDCNTLQFFGDDPWSVVAERLDGLAPDRFVHAVGTSNYDMYLLDLDVLDGGGNPAVAHWAYKEREIGDHRQFWEWLDSTGIDLLLRP